MSRSKERLIEETGGFRFGEGETAFKERVAEIKKLEDALRSTVGLSTQAINRREQIQRRLCKLKGIDFDAPELGDND